MGPWLRRKDSNLQSPDPESGGLPISRLLKLAVLKLKELARRVKLRNDFQCLLESSNCALFAQDPNDIMNAWTNGGTGQRDAHGLSEVAHL